jgi:hypothetical protein
MMPETAIALEISPQAPRVTSRLVMENHTPESALKRLLAEFGMPPLMVGFRRGEGEVLVMGRDRHTNQVVPFGRVFYGLTLDQLNTARQGLIDAKWEPLPPTFEMWLPDGRTV